jgi:hypothetical protein
MAAETAVSELMLVDGFFGGDFFVDFWCGDNGRKVVWVVDISF